MSEQKELAKSFVVALIHSGYFANEPDCCQKIVDTYNTFLNLLTPQKPNADALKKLRESM